MWMKIGEDRAMADRSAELSSFLRARRAAVTPQEVGLVPGDGRRVQGLRREELALLAGLSTDYYRRLEQGREPQDDRITASPPPDRRRHHGAHNEMPQVLLPRRIRVAAGRYRML